jgi:bifunctional NMN adenylyltransferase/nudix hydrolase
MYPDVIVLRQMDSPESNEHWSDTLDKKIATVTKGGNAILYGSRDSFIPLYSGAHPTKEVPELPNYSATKARQEALRANPENTEWLKGWLAAVHFQEAVIESTVNSEVGDREEERVSQ